MSWDGSYLPKSLLEAIAAHLWFECLGYSLGNEVFISFSRDKVDVILSAEGKRCSFCVGQPEFNQGEMEDLWLRLISEYNNGGTMTPEDKEKIYFSSRFVANASVILLQMYLRGFRRFLLLRQNIQSSIN